MQPLLTWLVPRYAGAPRLLSYVLGAVLLGAALAITQAGPPAGLLTGPMLLWLVISIAAELLWLETLGGDCTDSMASSANFAVIFLLAPGPVLWIIGISVFVATRVIQKRDWIRSLFGFGQIVITAELSLRAFHLLHAGPVTIRSLHSPLTGAAMLLAGAVYFFANTWLVSGAVSLERGTPFWTSWRQNYAYRNSVVTAVALFSLSPLLVLSFLTLGFPGVVLFFVPMLIIKNQNKEYIDLQKMTRALISSERMAAKGEMAAEVAHEINNYLAVLSGRTQLLLMKAGKSQDEKLRNDAEIIQTQIQRMNTLAKGLLDFSHKGIRIQTFDVNKLVADTVEFVRPQNLFDSVALTVELDPLVGEVQADAGQLQQVLINLLRNAAEAMRGRKGDGPAAQAPDPAGKAWSIHVRTQLIKNRNVRISVRDAGPGIPRENLGRVFEPAFTTKPDGHGYGLATCYRILQNHHGRIWAESAEGEGASFIMEFPVRPAGEASPVPEDEAGSRMPGAA